MVYAICISLIISYADEPGEGDEGGCIFGLGQAGTGKYTVIKRNKISYADEPGDGDEDGCVNGINSHSFTKKDNSAPSFGLLDGRYPLEHLQKIICNGDCYRTIKTMILYR